MNNKPDIPKNFEEFKDLQSISELSNHLRNEIKEYLNQWTNESDNDNIAPDAIHMRGNVTRKEKGVTHLISEDRFPSMEIFEYLNMNMELAWKEYILGYFAHIYADI